jgi:hypothetical protein
MENLNPLQSNTNKTIKKREIANKCKLDNELTSSSQAKINHVARSNEGLEHYSIGIGTASSLKLVGNCKSATLSKSPPH